MLHHEVFDTTCNKLSRIVGFKVWEWITKVTSLDVLDVWCLMLMFETRFSKVKLHLTVIATYALLALPNCSSLFPLNLTPEVNRQNLVGMRAWDNVTYITKQGMVDCFIVALKDLFSKKHIIENADKISQCPDHVRMWLYLQAIIRTHQSKLPGLQAVIHWKIAIFSTRLSMKPKLPARWATLRLIDWLRVEKQIVSFANLFPDSGSLSNLGSWS